MWNLSTGRLSSRLMAPCPWARMHSVMISQFWPRQDHRMDGGWQERRNLRLQWPNNLATPLYSNLSCCLWSAPWEEHRHLLCSSHCIWRSSCYSSLVCNYSWLFINQVVNECLSGAKNSIRLLETQKHIRETFSPLLREIITQNNKNKKQKCGLWN